MGLLSDHLDQCIGIALRGTDDIILNTCGGMIGYAGFCICKKAYHIYAKHRKKQHKKGKEGFYEQKEKK